MTDSNSSTKCHLCGRSTDSSECRSCKNETFCEFCNNCIVCGPMNSPYDRVRATAPAEQVPSVEVAIRSLSKYHVVEVSKFRCRVIRLGHYLNGGIIVFDFASEPMTQADALRQARYLNTGIKPTPTLEERVRAEKTRTDAKYDAQRAEREASRAPRSPGEERRLVREQRKARREGR